MYSPEPLAFSSQGFRPSLMFYPVAASAAATLSGDAMDIDAPLPLTAHHVAPLFADHRAYVSAASRQPLLVFDLDGTLVRQTVDARPFRHIAALFQDGGVLHGFRKCIASYNALAYRTTELAQLNDKFEIILGCMPVTGRGETVAGGKVFLIRMIANMLNVPLQDMIFFDDDENNVADARQAGVVTILVDGKTGVTLNDVQQGLQLWNKIHGQALVTAAARRSNNTG